MSKSKLSIREIDRLNVIAEEHGFSCVCLWRGYDGRGEWLEQFELFKVEKNLRWIFATTDIDVVQAGGPEGFVRKVLAQIADKSE